MGDADASLAVARGQLGYSESPAGSNRTKFGKWYGLDGQPWCDMFQSWVAAQAGNADIAGRFAYTPSHAAWFQSRGQWHTGRDAKVGDLVFFNFDGTRIHHIGLVEAVRADGIVTIEGNTSAGDNANGGQVQRRFRAWSPTIVGFGRPAYGPAKLTTLGRLYWFLWAGREAKRKPFLQFGSEANPALVPHIKDAQRAFGLDPTGVFGVGLRNKVTALQAFCKIPHRGPAGRLNRKTWQWLIYDVFTRGRR